MCVCGRKVFGLGSWEIFEVGGAESVISSSVFFRTFVIKKMGSLNDLLLPIIDTTDAVWTTFFCPQELAAVKTLISDLQQPMLGMGGIVPLDLDDRLVFSLQLIVGAVDVSCFLFFLFYLLLCSFRVVALMSCPSKNKR